jgi:hypothetical protein
MDNKKIYEAVMVIVEKPNSSNQGRRLISKRLLVQIPQSTE